MNTNKLYYLLEKVRCQGTELNTFYELGFKKENVYYDTKGMFAFGYTKVGDSKTMFTSHLDTVETHRVGLTKKVFLDPGTNQLFANNQVLGADDGAGVALLCHMITEGVAGHYFFFAGEEIGGIGSSYLADNFSELFPTLELNRAIAFDRKGTIDVVVSQFCGGCCSDSFALALCKELGTGYKPANGSFTDTANFIDFIPECTNISVGYYNEHSKNEYLDLTYLQSLAKKVCEIDWERLPTSRVCEATFDREDLYDTFLVEDEEASLYLTGEEEYFSKYFW